MGVKEVIELTKFVVGMAIDDMVIKKIFGKDPLNLFSEENYTISDLIKEFSNEPEKVWNNKNNIYYDKNDKESYLVNSKYKSETCVTISSSGVKKSKVKYTFPTDTGISISKSGVKKAN